MSSGYILYSGGSSDPDLQITGRGAPGDPDPEIRGGGSLHKIFLALRASVWFKNKTGAPPLDPPLLYTKWAVDYSPTPISQNVICLVCWHKQTSLRS